MTALMVGHAIFTTGKNTPTPVTGSRKRRVIACDCIRVESSCIACHSTYRLQWRDLFRFSASRFRYISCTGIAYHRLSVLFYFVYVFLQVRSNTILCKMCLSLSLFYGVFDVEFLSVFSWWMWPMCKCSPQGLLGLLSISSITSGRSSIGKCADGSSAYWIFMEQ